MSLLLADREPLEVSTEDLQEVIDTWAMRHARTRTKVTSVIRAFWVSAEEEGHVAISSARWRHSPRPARPKRPRAGGTIRPSGRLIPTICRSDGGESFEPRELPLNETSQSGRASLLRPNVVERQPRGAG